MSESVALSKIKIDAGTQIRAAIDQQVVTDYAEAMTNGATFPPIVVFHDGNQYYLGDGFHRVLAAQRLEFRDIAADLRAGTKEDALWFALGANRTNGKRLTEGDKHHAVVIALSAWPDKSPALIAEQVGCTRVYVQRIREQGVPGYKVPARTTGRDGRSYPTTRVKTMAEQEKHEKVTDLVKQGLSNDAIVKAVGGTSNTTLAKIRREVGVASPIDKSRSAIASRREQMRKMAGDGHTSRQIAAAVGLSEDGCRNTLKREGIDVPADRAVGHIKRHDSNRIMERIVMDAENLTEGVNLIEFADLNRDQLAEWLRSLSQSRDKLGAFIRRLMKEQSRNGEAA